MNDFVVNPNFTFAGQPVDSTAVLIRYTYTGDDSASTGTTYASGTGLWTIGALASGASIALNLTVTVNAAGSYTNAAQVTASDQTDPDSTPNNGIVNGGFAVCSGAGHCRVPTGTFSGMCIAPAADGAACDAANGPGCTSPATCTNGSCKLPDPANCK